MFASLMLIAISIPTLPPQVEYRPGYNPYYPEDKLVQPITPHHATLHSIRDIHATLNLPPQAPGMLPNILPKQCKELDCCKPTPQVTNDTCVECTNCSCRQCVCEEYNDSILNDDTTLVTFGRRNRRSRDVATLPGIRSMGNFASSPMDIASVDRSSYVSSSPISTLSAVDMAGRVGSVGGTVFPTYTQTPMYAPMGSYSTPSGMVYGSAPGALYGMVYGSVPSGMVYGSIPMYGGMVYGGSPIATMSYGSGFRSFGNGGSVCGPNGCR